MIKDILGFVIYLIWLFGSVKIPIDVMWHLTCFSLDWSTKNEIFIIIIPLMSLTFPFMVLWLLMYITNYALDKKWSRILNVFFEKVQYSTLFLILLIALQIAFKDLNLWFYIIFYIFIYLSTIARKFFKE